MVNRKIFASVSAFACGAVVAMVVLAARQELTAAPATFVHTCAAADGSLRYTDATVPCAPDERRIRITSPGKKDPDCKDDKERVQKLENRLKDLEYRHRMGTLRGRRVKAPFEVATKAGNPLMRVEEQNVTFYNRDRKPVVWILADESGGMLQAQTADGTREVTIAAQDRRSHLVAKEQGQVRVDLGRRDNGLYSVQLFGAQGKQVAGFGQSQAGSGILLVGDAAGTRKVSLHINQLPNGGTRAEVANAAGEIVGWMSAASGGGQLRILDSGGVVKAEAGLTVNDVGVVRTFPGNCHSGVGIVGVIPDCIVGRRP